MVDVLTLSKTRPDVLALIKVPDDSVDRQFGDIDRETQQVRYVHQCVVGGDVSLTFGFSSYRAGEQKQTCPHCQLQITVVKYNGGEFIAYDGDMAEELLLEA